ncbi:MAG: glucodextranase DOMON-like domain-containing protein, partial [Solirubrobacteraceae bacterium]
MRLLAGVSGAARATIAAVLIAITLGVLAGVASASSLYSGPGPRPGPDILYEPTAVAPQLTNSGIWQAPPILVSGTTAYRDGEFLYQDYLYDDHGAHEVPDPADPRAQGDTFSKPNGTYTYPTGPGYANNAADLVEFRVKPTTSATAFRVTFNTLENPSLIAFSIALGGQPGHTFAFPDGANVIAPAHLFLTVHPSGSTLVADLVHAGSDTPVAGPAAAVHVDLQRRQIEVDVPHQDWNPGQRTLRMAMGVGLWNAATGKYLLPQATASATNPGGAGTATNPAAFFNVAFRTAEPEPSVTAETGAVTDPAWWRDQQQGAALAAGDISLFFANVNFAKLADNVTDNSQVPTTGPMDRILASHFEPAQGANYSGECGLQGAEDPSTCVPEYQGNLQPYAVYIPADAAPAGGYGMTLLLHSLSANYNQYLGSRNESEFANRPEPSIVITPEARGPDQEYEGLGAADVFEAWADIARLYPLNQAYSDITGYSMGGIGTFKLGSQFPDLFARAQPTVGFETNNDVLASLRNLPVLMWNVSSDELVNATDYTQSAEELSSLGYRYELDVYQPCANSLCSPVLPNHLMLAINDQFAPAAAFLGSATVNLNPAHVTYVVDTARNHSNYGLVGDHAYWVSGLTIRSQSHTATNGDPEGQIDVFSHGFGASDRTASGSAPGTGTLTGGNMGPLAYASLTQTWGPATPAPASDTLDISATNIATATIDVSRARVDCNAKVNVTTDGPVTVT